MLRRTKTIVLKDDEPAETPAGEDVLEIEPVGRRRDSAAGGDVGAMHAEIEKAFGGSEAPSPDRVPKGAEGDGAAGTGPRLGAEAPERRRPERRGMDALREEALRNVISMVEDKNFGGLRDETRWRMKMPVSRLALLGVAVVAGGVALVLALQNGPKPAPQAAPEPQVQVVQEPRTRILVAREPIGVGQRLSAASLEWQDWPEGAVRQDYITVAMVPDAVTQMAGAVARYEIFPGEPIREQKLVQGGAGMLSAVLGGGMRAVSVPVAAASAAGGFILPNDHVDVVLTRGPDGAQFSETILSNVRVLAIGGKLAEAPGGEEAAAPEVFDGEAIATVELDPVAAEVLIGARSAGRLSLVLRSILDFAEAESPDWRPSNQAIRLSSPFWTN